MSLGPALRERGGFFLLSLSVVVLDQVTKLWADHYLSERPPLVVIPDWFSLWYSRNAGGLFGVFRELGSPWRTLLLTLLPALAVVFIAGFLARTRAADRATLLGLALVLGGAAGNLIDRVFRGEVIDFLDVYVSAGRMADRLIAWFGTAHWPTFNVADSAIVVGAGLLLLSIVRPGQPVGALPTADRLSTAAATDEPL